MTHFVQMQRQRHHKGKLKVKVKSVNCYSATATYTIQTRALKRFTISEVAADWYKLMIPQRIMWPSFSRCNEELCPRCLTLDLVPPVLQSTLGSSLSPV